MKNGCSLFVKIISVNRQFLCHFHHNKPLFSQFFKRFTRSTVSVKSLIEINMKKENITCDQATISRCIAICNFTNIRKILTLSRQTSRPFYSKSLIHRCHKLSRVQKMTEFCYSVKSTWPKVLTETESPILRTSLVFGSILLGNDELLLDSTLQVFLFFS